MKEFGTREYYEERVSELEDDISIYVAALKQFCMVNRYDEDIICVCKKISQSVDNLNYANKELNRLNGEDKD